MASHGVARSARTPRSKERRDRDIERICKYRGLEEQLRTRVTERQLDHDTFLLTSQLLRLNPEYYTVWNIRRRCLMSGLLVSGVPNVSSSYTSPPFPADSRPISSSEDRNRENLISKPGINDGFEMALEQIEGTILSELGFTVPLLVEYPKCYWIWKYRLWILDQASNKLPMDAARVIWKEELGLVSKMLLKDRRNFHAWGYRRHVVSQLEGAVLGGKSSVESEFAYTTKAIHEDLSNFSAWHNRSQLIPRLLQEREADENARKEFLEAELALVHEALNLGPEDQSLWYYHHYLCSNLTEPDGSRNIVPNMSEVDRRACMLAEMSSIQELAEDYAGIKWVYQALLEYTLAISQLDSRSVGEGEKQEIASWLAKLRALDPKRNGRWNDLEIQLDLA